MKPIPTPSTARGPLRKIVELLDAGNGSPYGRRKVGLECGHNVWCSSGAIYRARCRHCKGAKAIPTPETSDSDWGEFQAAAAERPAPIKPEEMREFLAEVHRLAQRERFAQTEVA
jgi:hypothetical protein